MANQTSIVVEAIRQLALLRGGLQDDGYRFALAWLAGARMAQLGMLPDGNRLTSLTTESAWHSAHPVAGKLCAEIIWSKGSSMLKADLEFSQAASIVARLLERVPDFYLMVPDALFYLPALRNTDWPVLAPEVCDLLFSVLEAPTHSKVWIPFDPLGQLISRALKLGLEFETAGPRAWDSNFSQLCNAVLGIFDKNLSIGLEAQRGADGKLDFAVDYLIAVPPIGERLPQQMGWYEWEGEDMVLAQIRGLVQQIGLPMHLRLDRSDTWAPAALWPRVKQNAVFLSAQSLLFARGQEQRLRDAWVRSSYPVAMILSLPVRMFAHMGVAPALFSFKKQSDFRRVLMADLSEFTVRTGIGGRPGKTLDLERSLATLGIADPFKSTRRPEDTQIGHINHSSYIEDVKFVRSVSFDELMNGECNLQPTRYLQPPLKLSGDRLRLHELVEVIRAPVPTTDPFSVEAIEVGMPELDGWRPIRPLAPSTQGKEVRKAQVRERRLMDAALVKGDIVMSIKGNVGRTALIDKSLVHSNNQNHPQKTWSLVTSGNCIALRPRGDAVTSEYLLMYFRSEEFQRQLEALVVGAVIPHVTPDALCDNVKIPIPTSAEMAAIQEKYQQLCNLEDRSEAAKNSVTEIVKTLWKLDR